MRRNRLAKLFRGTLFVFHNLGVVESCPLPGGSGNVAFFNTLLYDRYTFLCCIFKKKKISD
jgi:hypothetical protein